MKRKNLKKKIQQLEKRLREGPAKLSKLRRKLQAAEAKKKSAAPVGRVGNGDKNSMKGQKTKSGVKANIQTKPAGEDNESAPKVVKRKLNLSPERRAQLSAAMKARWAAKRAAAAAPTPQTAPAAQGFIVADPN